MPDDEYYEFCESLGLIGVETRDWGCQAGGSGLTLEARQHASEDVRQRAVGRTRLAEPGTASTHSKFRPALDFS